jgi:hypothetical protein
MRRRSSCRRRARQRPQRAEIRLARIMHGGSRIRSNLEVSIMAATAAAVRSPAEPLASAVDDKLMAEARIGFEELRKLSHAELRGVIARRVHLLETVLKDREERRAAIETAKMAGKLLDIRRERAVRIHKTVNTSSWWAAAATMCLMFAVMV